MTDIEKKALALVKELTGKNIDSLLDDATFWDVIGALYRAIEQHEAFRQEVSDAVESLVDMPCSDPDEVDLVAERLGRFIIAKPDPLVDALLETFPRANGAEGMAADLRAAIKARGGRIVWEGE